jgi:predicted GNAT superfamily acetyltransferase
VNPSDDRMNDSTYVERFTPTDLKMLRNELLQSGVDSRQAAEIVTNFLSGRGYGVSSLEARSAASLIEGPGCTPEHIQQELERVALVM